MALAGNPDRIRLAMAEFLFLSLLCVLESNYLPLSDLNCRVTIMNGCIVS